MGNGYNHQPIHHHHFHQKSIFWPMLCRLSIKDVVNLDNHSYQDRIVPSSETNKGDPSSPKVSCMGQVKRNNRRVTAVVHRHKYTKLKKLFSGKILMAPTIAAASSGVRSGSRSCRTSEDHFRVCNSTRLRLKNECGDDRRDFVKVVMNIGEMDPPLPVVKKAAPPDEVNLWKRRFNGAGLRSLQIHLPSGSAQVQPPTTV